MASSIDSIAIEFVSHGNLVEATSNGLIAPISADADNELRASRIADSSVPDGGYGWIVIFSCSLITWWYVGTTYSWGVIQAALVEHKLSSASTLSFVVSVTPAQYFSKKRGLANGIVYAGGGLGGTVISFAMDGLIQNLGPAWTFRIIGLMTLGTGLPAAWLIKERAPIRSTTFIEWRLFRDFRFVVLFLAGAIATFPLFVPPFFLPLYSTSLGLSPSAGAGLVAGFNFSSAVGRLGCGFLCDAAGPLNTLAVALALSAGSMLVLWPAAGSLGPLIAFVVVNGAANGGFFATMPTVVGAVFGSQRVSVTMGMIVTGWAGGYLMVCFPFSWPGFLV
ncbi:hypothetical protein MMC12_002195 [Toensbergia leucococca]|nr:hypothetical protein [Toensbergia leucococca]